MEIKNVNVYGLKESIIRSGYPMSIGNPDNFIYDFETNELNISHDDIKRAYKLANTPPSSGHANYRKGIIVQFDLKYTQYLTPQLQRYNWIDIVSSQSKMHRLTRIKEVKEHCNSYVLPDVYNLIDRLIDAYNTDVYPWTIDQDTSNPVIIKDKYECFYYIISNLPMGYKLWMGISTNYEQLATIYRQRKNHKLKEDWGYFCEWIKSLPMSELITNNK